VDILDLWTNSLQARRLSPRTINSYIEDASSFSAFTDDRARAASRARTSTSPTQRAPTSRRGLRTLGNKGLAAAAQARMWRFCSSSTTGS
jgi:hypothetical protein